MLKHALVPLDGSSLAEEALHYAAEIVDPNGQITLFTAVYIPELPIYEFYPTPVSIAQEYEIAVVEAVPRAQDYLKQAAEQLQQRTSARVNLEVASGDAAEAVIETAKALNADVIVMSTHGRSGLNRWLFGSVTQKVLSGALCPVLVIPSKQRLQAANAVAAAEKSQ